MEYLTVDILEKFINEIDFSEPIVSVTYNATANESSVKLNDVYNLRKSMMVTFDNVLELKVISVDNNDNSFVVTGDMAVYSTVTIPTPFYFHGTPLMTANHLAHLADASQVPMIYLRETLREVTPSWDSAYLRISQIRLYFIDNANIEDWLTDDHYSKRLVGLSKLADKFIEELRNRGDLFYTYETEFERLNQPNWGNYVDLRGFEANIFNGHYTAIEMDFELNILKTEDCLT